jgi:glycosyltransferase involved in cell wall biosynthesis
MRVLQLGPFPPPHGGVQSNLVAIHDLLRQQEHQCAVINLTRFRRPDADGVYYPQNAPEVVRLLLRLRYDILHLHLGGMPQVRLLRLALFCCLMPGVKTVLTFHSGGYATSSHGRSAGPRTLRGFIWRRFDRIIAVNPEIIELFRRFGVPDSHVRLIYPHALPARPEEPLPEGLQRFFDTHKPLLVTVGLLEPEYDLPLQIDVLGEVRRRFSNAGLMIIGAGSLEQTLRSRIEGKPYAEHVALPGDVSHAATLRVMADCDVFLRTTLYDGDSVSVREALHFGAPVIATDNRMRPEGVYLIPPSDPGALCKAIEYCLVRAAPRRSHGANYDNIAAVLGLYEELLAS